MVSCRRIVTSTSVPPDSADARPQRPRPEKTPVPLSQLDSGDIGLVQAADLAGNESALLRALGLTTRSLIRVCKAGDPCIVQVRTTRIGLSREVAKKILVVPEGR